MDHAEFQRKVAAVVDGLPPEIRRGIANVAIVVEDLADDETLDMAGIDNPYELLGFYHGVPLTQRTGNYGLVLPDKISIYREPILALGGDQVQTIARIKRTVLHELAHYFGIDDDRLEEIGAY
jgi:predicted Zn-dependent protease with MMP-like domain